MKNQSKFILLAALLAVQPVIAQDASAPDYSSAILTPAPPATPRINGPSIFGVRPGSPCLYQIPATGNRPMQFAVENLPDGLAVDSQSGQITGTVKRPGEYRVTLIASNILGIAKKPFRIVVGEKIALTPPLGWNSWNFWGKSVDQTKILKSAKQFVTSGLINHGWSYINIDDTWQGKRNPLTLALQANEKFPDMQGLCSTLHQMGLKAGIYSTPWIASYQKYPGGSSDNSDGAWSSELATNSSKRYGKFAFTQIDANQWAQWGFDYLKYDWSPNDVPHTAEMSVALRKSGRDIIFSLSNTAPPDQAADWARWANCWRTTMDIRDNWGRPEKNGFYGVSEIAFAQDSWATYAGPGHWNDPDMLVLGYLGWGEKFHWTPLTPDEQYTHISMWCMLAAPLLIGCDLEKLDPFTISLLSNDEVLAVNQDALGQQAVRVATLGAVDVYMKSLEDGSKAVGFFNRDSVPQSIAFNKFGYLGIKKRQQVRDLWRQVNLPDYVKPPFKTTIPAHGVQLYKLTPVLMDGETN